MLIHTVTEKDNVLTGTKTKEKKNIYLKWGKNCKNKKKKSKRQRKSIRLRISERIKK